MIGIQLSAVDTLYFRNSTSYAATLTSPEHHGGQFPPHPTTVVGAMRAMLARGQGWCEGWWKSNIIEVLGTGYGPDDLGQLHFDGPYLLRDGKPVYPMPAHLLGKAEHEGWKPATALRPGPPVMCDLGDAVRLPVWSDMVDTDRLSPAKNQWLTQAGMDAVLRGVLPQHDEVIDSRELWTSETRVGIERDDETRTVRDHMLYTSRHIRPERNVTIGMRIGGVPDDWRNGDGVTVPLGGEGRWAERQPWDGDAACESPLEEVLTTGEMMIIALAPIDAGEEFYRVGGRIADLGDATIVSACLPRMERIGGWASHRNASGPLPLRSILPAGSTFFCEVNDPDALRAAVRRAGGARVGEWQRWGYGAVAIGVWPPTTTEGAQ